MCFLNSCSADVYGLEDLKRLALRKQGLRSGMQISTILASARYAYNHTPDSDSKLRAQYLTLIIRSRNNFKMSGTMKVEMEQGGLLFFDLFVAMCNHMVSYSSPLIFNFSRLTYGRMISKPSAPHSRHHSLARSSVLYHLCYQIAGHPSCSSD